jgi:DNA-binding transcriptional MerR regulator
MQEENQDWSIGELARRGGVSVKTIRFYSDAGLLPPRRSWAGHRRYDATDLARLTLIRSLRSLDVGLDTIGELLTGATDLQECLRAQERVLQLRLLTVRRQLAVCRASAQDDAEHHADRLQALTRIEAAERDRLLEQFWDTVLPERRDETDRMRRAGTPELPPEPTAAQVDAWLELTELAADPDFRDTVRRNADWFSQHTTDGFDHAGWPDRLAPVFTLAEPLIASGIDPGDERAAPAVAALVDAYAAAFGRADTPEFRCWLSQQLQQATDPRAARWWQLVAVIQPSAVHPGGPSSLEEHRRRARATAWLHTALHLHARTGHRTSTWSTDEADIKHRSDL